MIDRLSRILIRWRYVVWLVVLPVTAVSWILLPPVEFDQSIEGFFPPDHPALLSYQASERAFGGDQLIFVAYDDPGLWTDAGMDRVRMLADRIAAEVPGVERVDSLDQMPVPWRVDRAVEAAVSDRSLGGALRILAGRTTVRTLVHTVTDDPEQQSRIRERICAHPLFNGLLVNGTGTTTAVIARLKLASKPDQRASVLALRQVADEFAREHKFEQAAVAGSAVLVVDGFISLERDNRTLGAVSMALMALTMLIAVRNPAWALLSLIAGLATWELARMFITVFQLKLSLSAGPIIAQTIVLCMPAASHLAIRFFGALRAGRSRDEAALSTLSLMFGPVAWCAVASASGYLAAWIATTVTPVAHIGMTMFACNLTAGILVWCLSAGAMTIPWAQPKSEAARFNPGAGAVAEQVGRMTGWVLDHPRTTLGLVVGPMLLATIGISRVQVESNYITVHKSGSRVARDYRFIESRMGGIGLVELIFPAPAVVTPDWLDRLAETGAHLRDANQDLVTGVVSLADLLNSPSEAGEEERDRIVAMKIRTLEQPKYSKFLDTLWQRPEDGAAGQARILVRIREGASPERKAACFANLTEIARQEISAETFITGVSHLMTQITHAVVGTSFYATIWSGVISVAILWIALRHLRLALLAFAPTLLAVGLVLGIMGWVGLKIDMSTALVAGVAIGLSIDDAVHCLLRWKQEVQAGRTSHQALKAAYAGAGPGVLLSSSAVSLGFLAMLFSEFVPMSNFGWLVAVATAGGSLGNLVVIPAVLELAVRRQTDRPGKLRKPGK